MPSAIAPNWSARTALNATDVTGPASCPASRSATSVAGAAAPAPIPNVKPPDTGCESAETTRNVTV